MPAKAAEPSRMAPTAPPTATAPPPPGFQPSASPTGEQDGGLQQLDRDDGDDLGPEQAGTPERGGPQALEHAVAALEAGGDAERDHGGRHDGQRQNAGHEEVGRCRGRGRHHRDLREEEQEDDRDAEGQQQGLAAAQRHVDLGAGLRGQRPQTRRRSVLPPLPPASGCDPGAAAACPAARGLGRRPGPLRPRPPCRNRRLRGSFRPRGRSAWRPGRPGSWPPPR